MAQYEEMIKDEKAKRKRLQKDKAAQLHRVKQDLLNLTSKVNAYEHIM